MNLPQQPINAFEKHLQKVKIRHIPKLVNTILDIGCGDGSVFDGTRYECDGYDIDLESLALTRYSRNYHIISDSLNVFNPNKYDCVAILGTLEHMEVKHINKLFSNLKTAKSIYITVPNANSFHRQVGVDMGIIDNIHQLQEQDYEIGHKRYYDIDLLDSHLQPLYDYGFRHYTSGSEGFKFDTSVKMIEYLPSIKSIEKVARKQNMIGLDNFAGAELFIYLCKR